MLVCGYRYYRANIGPDEFELTVVCSLRAVYAQMVICFVKPAYKSVGVLCSKQDERVYNNSIELLGYQCLVHRCVLLSGEQRNKNSIL